MIQQFLQWILNLLGWNKPQPASTPPPEPPAYPSSVTYTATADVVEITAKPLIAPHRMIQAIEACFGVLADEAKTNIGYIADAMYADNMWRREHVAYTLATVYHETAGSWAPVEEAYWLSDPEAYRRKLRYYPWHGRGYSQLTWESNYLHMSRVTGYDLISDPDMAMVPIVAAEVLVYGMLSGFYPGAPTLHRYLNDDKTDFYNARRVVNVLDKAHLISNYAQCIDEQFKKQHV